MTDEKIVIRLEPDPDMLDVIHARSMVGDVPLFTCRWWEEGKCLAIFQVREKGGHLVPGDYYVRMSLRDGKGWPRQPDGRDLNELDAVLQAARSRRDLFDRQHEAKLWYQENVLDPNAEAERKSLEQFQDDNEQIRKQYAACGPGGRFCWHGIRKDVDCPTCNAGKKMAEEADARARRWRKSIGA